MQAVPISHAAANQRSVGTESGPLSRDRSLALRERAVLRLAARQGAVAVIVRREGRPIAAAYDRLDVCARLSERGLLRYAGLREVGGGAEVLYEI